MTGCLFSQCLVWLTRLRLRRSVTETWSALAFRRLARRPASKLSVAIVMLACLSAFLYLAANAAAATVLNVDASHGTDSGNCQATPCKTLTYAIKQAGLLSVGARIDVAAGTYSEDVALGTSVNGLTIAGAGSSDDPTKSTVISGVFGANTIDTGAISTLTLEHLRVANAPSDPYTVINGQQVNLALTDVAVDQQANKGEGIDLQTGAVTIKGGSVTVDGTESEGYALDVGTFTGSGNVTLEGTTVTANGSGYGINTWGGVHAIETTIAVTNASHSGYAINANKEVQVQKTHITVAGEGYGINTRGPVTASESTIDITDPEGSGYAINAEGDIFSTEVTLDVAGKGYGENTDGEIILTNSTINLTSAERFTGYGANARGRISIHASHINVAGEGYGASSANEMLLEKSTINLTNPTGIGYGAYSSGLRATDDEITVAGEGEGLESSGAMTLENDNITVLNLSHRADGVSVSGDANLTNVSVNVAGEGGALSTAGSLTAERSTFTSGTRAAEPTILDQGEPNHDTVIFRHSTIAGMSASEPSIDAEDVQLAIDNSLVTGGSGITFGAFRGESLSATLADSTVDAATLGVRDKQTSSLTALVDSNTASSAHVEVKGSILVEPPAAQLPPPLVRPPLPRTSTPPVRRVAVDCSYTEVPSTSQVESATHGAINCESGTDGNTYTELLSEIFANPATGYTLNPTWDGVDSVPSGVVSLPFGLEPSSTDLAGHPRALNGSGSCLPPAQDKGAFELTDHEGVVPDPLIETPESVTAGAPAQFTVTASNSSNATFSWESSDGASGTGATFTHAFQIAGSYTVTLTAAGGKACVATASTTINVKAKPVSEPGFVSVVSRPVAPGAAAQLALICANRRLTLTDVLIQQDHVLLTGAAEGKLAGQRATILFQGKKITTAKILRNGLFTTTAPLPPANIRYTNQARYQAKLGKLRSLNLKLTRRLILQPPTDNHDKITLTGQILPPLTHTPITITEEGTNCTHPKTIARIKPTPNGHYTITIPAPTGRRATVYRLSSQVRANTHSQDRFPTYSLTETIQLH